MFSNGRPGQNIWVHKIWSRCAENSGSEVNPRLENKNTEIPSKLENAYIVSEALKPTTLASGNNKRFDSDHEKTGDFSIGVNGILSIRKTESCINRG